VVVDETHERQAQGDFLLTALRELVEGSRANTNFTVNIVVEYLICYFGMW